MPGPPTWTSKWTLRPGFAGGSTYVASKFALRGMTECWRAELRKHNVRVTQINPSEVLTEFAEHAGREQASSDRKLRPSEIAHLIVRLKEELEKVREQLQNVE